MITDYYNREISIGDHIKTYRCKGIYSHHGVYIGENKVIHFTGELRDGLIAGLQNHMHMIEYETLDNFELGNKSIIVNNISKHINYKDFVKSTQKYLGPKQYNLITYNCEHFANEITRESCKSDQVNSLKYASVGSALTVTVISVVLHPGVLVGGLTGTVVFYGIRKFFV